MWSPEILPLMTTVMRMGRETRVRRRLPGEDILIPQSTSSPVETPGMPEIDTLANPPPEDP